MQPAPAPPTTAAGGGSKRRGSSFGRGHAPPPPPKSHAKVAATEFKAASRFAALQAKRETLGECHPSTLASMNNLGVLLQAQGDLGGAAPLIREEAEEAADRPWAW